MIYIGSALTLIGLVGLGYCILEGLRIRRAGGTTEENKGRFQRLIAINFGALALSAFGLICVIMGIFLD